MSSMKLFFALSVNDDHSMINDNVFQKYIEEDTLKSLFYNALK